MLFYPCYLCGFQLYPSFGGGIVEVYAIHPKKWGFEARVYPNRGAFSCPCVGAYCIRPTNVPFMGRMIQTIDHRCAFLSPAGPFGGAYAIRPYPDGRKMIAAGVCFAALPEKRAAFRGCYEVGGGKCGALDCFTVVACTNRGAMPASHCLAWRCSCSRRPVLFRSCGG